MNAYERGQFAAEMGLSIDCNPYSIDKQPASFDAWFSGYLDKKYAKVD